MTYCKLEITVAEGEQDVLIALLDEAGANGFEQTNSTLIAYFREEEFGKVAIAVILKDYLYTIGFVAETNWNAKWESSFSPVVVGTFCAIRAHFHPPILSVEHEIVITPKMSFGTGHHATTSMMVAHMQSIDFAGRRVFDFGTGTGILAILARKLGAISVTAIDNDEWSINNALENVERNSCTGISVRLADHPPAGPFQVILANINRPVILEFLPALAKSITAEGTLLLSGLLNADEEVIISAATDLRLSLQKRMTENGWVSLLFVNTSAQPG